MINGYAFCDIARQQEIRAKATASGWSTIPYKAIFLPQVPARPGDRDANLRESGRGDHGRGCEGTRIPGETGERRGAQGEAQGKRRRREVLLEMSTDESVVSDSSIGALSSPRAATSVGAQQSPTDADKDLPLREDTRLLGRLLGDVLRAQTGESGYARIEAIRQTAVRFRRAVEDDAPGGQAGARRAAQRPADRADAQHRPRVQLLLASRQHRRGRPPESAPPQPRARRLAAAAGKPRRRARMRRGPRHRRPTDRGVVRRRAGEPGADRAPDRSPAQEHSRLRARSRAASALARSRGAHPRRSRRIRGGTLPAGAGAVADGDDPARRSSRSRTRSRTVSRITATRSWPRCRSSIWRSPRSSTRSSASSATSRVPPFLRLGSWIGGDRDGNPLVNSATLSYAIDRQATVAFTHYLDEIHRLGAELSLSTRLVTPSPELLRARRGRARPEPAPQRRALPAGADRHLRSRRRHRRARSRATSRRARRTPTCRRTRTPASSSPTCAPSKPRSRCMARRRSPTGGSCR